MQVLSRLQQAIEAAPRWLIAAALGTVALYVYGTWPYSYWRRRGINGPAMWPLMGDLPRFIRAGGFRQMLMEDLRTFGRVYGTYFLRRPVLVIGDPEMVKQVCIKQADNFTDRDSLGTETRPLDKGVLVLKGQEWKRVRGLLTPTFSSGRIKAMHPMIERCALQLCHSLLKAPGGEVDLKIHFTNFTMDVVASTLFGLEIHTQENPDNDFNRHSRGIFSLDFFSWKIWALFMFPSVVAPLFRRFNVTLFKQESLDFFEDVISRALKERENCEDADKYQDFLASMVTAKREAESQGVRGLTEHEVMAQSLTLFLAGFETTANTLQYMVYFLAWNKDCQDRAYREIVEAKERYGGALTYECVQGLTYLNQCLDETMRMLPPVLFSDRICNEATVVNGYEIEKGVNVRIPIYSLAHDPDTWPDADTFNPDRFEKTADGGNEAGDQLHLIPFGLGPRNCIGMRLAQLEVRKAVAEMLLRLEFRPLPGKTRPFDQLEFKLSGILAPKEPIVLQVVPRSTCTD